MDAVARTVCTDITKGRKPTAEYTEAMRQYSQWRRTGACSCSDHAAAFRAQEDSLQKEIVEALLFGDADPEDVTQAFGVTAKTLAAYEELFFDRAKFHNKLDKLSYLENYPDPFGKELKKRALNLGPEFIYYTYANLVPRTAQQRLLVQRMFMATAYKAMAINYNGINASITKNAVDHAKLMLKAWEALQKFNEEDLGEDTDLVKVLTKGVDFEYLEPGQKLSESEIV